MSSAQEQQRRIYVRGISGRTPEIPTSFPGLEAAARKRMGRKAFAYIAGGAGAEQTLRTNRKAMERWAILPRMLRNVEERDCSIELFGQRLPSPFLLAPVGVLDLAHPRADLAVSRAAAATGAPFIFSNQASVSMEDCAAAMGSSPRWFQLYWSKSDALVKSLVKRAENCGCRAIVVTLDTTMLGWRPRDLDLAYLPFLEGRGIAQYTSDPVFNRIVDEPDEQEMDTRDRQVNIQTLSTLLGLMYRYPGSFLGNLRSKRPLKAVRTFINIYSRPSLEWKDLSFLRQLTDLPILLKGILHPEDAGKALNYGIDGLIVSNHGGRQIDGAISSMEVLPEIVDKVRDKVPVLLDSGIRSGADTFKALALGAKAVCLGRPYTYALAIDGEKGVRTLLDYYKAEFELTMGLAGCRHTGEINRSCLGLG
jgi:lactate 2-monooxygenase